jgi:hypothetical protein
MALRHCNLGDVDSASPGAELPLGRGVGDDCVELGAHCRTLFPPFLDSVGTAVDSVTVFSWSNRIESKHLPARDEKMEV